MLLMVGAYNWTSVFSRSFKVEMILCRGLVGLLVVHHVHDLVVDVHAADGRFLAGKRRLQGVGGVGRGRGVGRVLGHARGDVVVKRLDRRAVLRGQRQREEAGQGLGVGRVRADSLAAGGKLGGVLQDRVVDPDAAGLGTGEEGVDSQGGQRAAGVVAEGELRIGAGGRNGQLAVGDLGRQAADAVDFRGQAVERRVVAGAQQGDGNVGRGARARLRVRDDDLKRTVGRRERPGRPG